MKVIDALVPCGCHALIDSCEGGARRSPHAEISTVGKRIRCGIPAIVRHFERHQCCHVQKIFKTCRGRPSCSLKARVSPVMWHSYSFAKDNAGHGLFRVAYMKGWEKSECLFSYMTQHLNFSCHIRDVVAPWLLAFI